MTETPTPDRIYQGDALEVMRGWPDGFVQTVVTSPPFYGLRDYGVVGQIGIEKTPGEYVGRLLDVFREAKRVLKDDGTLWLNLGDSYAANRGYQVPQKLRGGAAAAEAGSAGGRASNAAAIGLKPKDLIGIPWRVAFALQADGWYLRSDIVWAKPNPMPESVTDRPTRCHEYIFLLTKSEQYKYDHQAIKEPCTSGPSDRKKMLEGKERLGGKSLGNLDVYCSASARTRVGTVRSVGHPDGRNKRSVWWVGTHGCKDAHFATFPEKLIQPCILAGAAIGDIVLDPFMGAGTTGLVAAKHGRRFLGVELNPEYIKIAERRVEPERLQAKLI